MRPGQAVTFRVDAYPTETFHGTVNQVRLNPVTVQNVVTYSTVIDVPNPELKLKPGMTANVNIEIARRDSVLRVPNAAIRFRPTKDIFDALNQAMPPELERGFGTRGNRGGQGGPNGQATGATPPGTAPQPTGTATAGQVGAKAQATPKQAPTAGAAAGDQRSARNRQPDGSPTGSAQAPGGGGSAGARGEGGRGGFSSMTPEERQKRMEERMAAMPPEERAAFQERLKQRQAQGGGRGGQGGGNFAGGGGRGQGAGADGSGNAARTPSAASSRTGQPAQAPNSKSAALTNATTIDALFAPLPVVESRGRAWLYVNKQLKPISLRLGITDGTFTEVLNDSELPADIDVVTSIVTPEMATRPANPNNANGNPLMPANRGRGPGGNPGGGGGRGGGR
jgi:hypothetical protein